MRQFRILLSATLLALSAVVFGAPSVQAQGRPSHSSFVTPFPEGDVYRVAVIGDWLAQGIHGGLSEAFSDETRVNFSTSPIDLRGFLRPEYEAGMAAVKSVVTRGKFPIAVVMSGAYDRVPIRGAGGGRSAVGSDEWNAVFEGRVDALMKVLQQANAAVYWVGLPVMRGEHRNDDVRTVNEIFRQKAYRYGIRYIDIFQATGDDDGEYSPYGPDFTGTVRLLRYKDGVHFTKAGYAKIAHLIEQQMRRDIAEAKSERDIPLLGGENEQKRIAPLRPAKMASAKGGGVGGSSAQGSNAQVSGPAGEPADSTELTLNLRGQSGRNQSTKIQLLRPAIAGSVIAVLTRGQSEERSARVGLTISDDLPSGLLVLRTITPSVGPGDGGTRVQASELPFFRVLVKGERLASVPGRADDFSWPRKDAIPPATPAALPRVASIRRPTPQWDPSIPPLPLRRPVRRGIEQQEFSPRLE